MPQPNSVLYFPGLSRYFDCFDSILEWDGISGMEVVFDSLIFLAVLIFDFDLGGVLWVREVRTSEQNRAKKSHFTNNDFSTQMDSN